MLCMLRFVFVLFFKSFVCSFDVSSEEAQGLVGFNADISDLGIPTEVSGDLDSEAVFCLRSCTQSVAVAEKYCDGTAVRRLVMFIAVPQFCRWKDIFQSHNPSLLSLIHI